MGEVDTDQLKQAVEHQHGGTATFVMAVPVEEAFESHTVTWPLGKLLLPSDARNLTKPEQIKP